MDENLATIKIFQYYVSPVVYLYPKLLLSKSSNIRASRVITLSSGLIIWLAFISLCFDLSRLCRGFYL